MSVKKEPNGRRSVQIEVEVPGTPQEVWQAIATGPGISSWFVPTEFEMKDGKPVAVKLNMGPGMESTSTLTAWEPLKRWASESDGWVPGMPNVAHEWSIQVRDGGVCVLRIVSSLFSSTDDWDNQLEATGQGWPGFFRTLRIYLTHYRGERSAIMQCMGFFAGAESEAWEKLTAALGVKGVSVGQRCAASGSGPGFSGVVEYAGENPYDILLRVDQPWPGVAAIGAFNCGGPIMVAMSFYLYGDRAAEIVAREKPLWDAWFQQHFPPPTE